jgi:hypothetical protein
VLDLVKGYGIGFLGGFRKGSLNSFHDIEKASVAKASGSFSRKQSGD